MAIGFLRLWLVFAVLWALAVALVSYNGIFHPAFGDLDQVNQRISRALGWGIGVPVFLLVLGAGLGWVMSGFRSQPPSQG